MEPDGRGIFADLRQASGSLGKRGRPESRGRKVVAAKKRGREESGER